MEEIKITNPQGNELVTLKDQLKVAEQALEFFNNILPALVGETNAKGVIIRGFNVINPPSNSMLVVITKGLAVFNDNAICYLHEDKNIAIQDNNSSTTRIDSVFVKPKLTESNIEQRLFINRLEKTENKQNVATRRIVEIEVTVLQGTSIKAPVTPVDSFKIAEVKIPAGENISVDISYIHPVDAKLDTEDNSNWTTEKKGTFRLDTLYNFKKSFSSKHTDTGDHHDQIIDTNHLADRSVTHPKLDLNSVYTENIQDHAVTRMKIGSGAVHTENLANITISNEKMAPNSVNYQNLYPGSVVKSKLGSDVIELIEQAKHTPHTTGDLSHQIEILRRTLDMRTGLRSSFDELGLPDEKLLSYLLSQTEDWRLHVVKQIIYAFIDQKNDRYLLNISTDFFIGSTENSKVFLYQSTAKNSKLCDEVFYKMLTHRNGDFYESSTTQENLIRVAFWSYPAEAGNKVYFMIGISKEQNPSITDFKVLIYDQDNDNYQYPLSSQRLNFNAMKDYWLEHIGYNAEILAENSNTYKIAKPVTQEQAKYLTEQQKNSNFVPTVSFLESSRFSRTVLFDGQVYPSVNKQEIVLTESWMNFTLIYLLSKNDSDIDKTILVDVRRIADCCYIYLGWGRFTTKGINDITVKKDIEKRTLIINPFGVSTKKNHVSPHGDYIKLIHGISGLR